MTLHHSPLAPLGSNGFACCGGVTDHNAWCATSRPPASDAPAPPREETEDPIITYRETIIGHLAASPAQEATPPDDSPNSLGEELSALRARGNVRVNDPRQEATPPREVGHTDAVTCPRCLGTGHDAQSPLGRGTAYDCPLCDHSGWVPRDRATRYRTARDVVEAIARAYVESIESYRAAPTPEATAPGEYDELFAEAADYIRSIHHYAGSADHPAMKERIEGDIAGILDDLRATVAALTAERGARAQGQDHQQD